MRINDIYALGLLLIAAAAWIAFAERPTTANLRVAVRRTLPIIP